MNQHTISELVAIATLLYGNFRSRLAHLPEVAYGHTFPYRLHNGMSNFTSPLYNVLIIQQGWLALSATMKDLLINLILGPAAVSFVQRHR